MTSLSLQTQNATPFNTAINTTNNVPTMTSLEIVEFINNHRQANGNSTVLRHSDFMAKVSQVIGFEYSEKFRSTYFVFLFQTTKSSRTNLSLKLVM